MITIIVWSYIIYDKFSHLDRYNLYIYSQKIVEYVSAKIYSYFICNYTEQLIHSDNLWNDIQNEWYFW